jgi:hypothetical protein
LVSYSIVMQNNSSVQPETLLRPTKDQLRVMSGA